MLGINGSITELLFIIVMTSVIVGVSLPEHVVQEIDNDRGDVSRSRFLLRLVQRAYKDESYNSGSNHSA